MTGNHRALDDSDIRLIERVKLTSSLYDPRNPDFRLAYRKEQEWDNVGAFVGMAAVDARRRWTCLRDRYTRELKQLRLHPEKEAFGRNDFFRLMDFLRKYVRKRRERRRHPMYKYDSSWDGSMDETKLAGKVGRSEKDDDTSVMEEQTYDEEAEQNYDNKVGAETDEYIPEYVEDTSEAYEEYVEHASAPETFNCNNNDKKTVLPILLPARADGATYTITTPQHLSNKLHIESQQHEQTLQQQQAPLQLQQYKSPQKSAGILTETADDYFCKSVAVYLRQLSRRHKIKAKVEMFQILEKYIELEENPEACKKEQS